jgi:hypothetical protein
MSIKGYPNFGKDDRLGQAFATVEPVRAKQDALSVIAHQFVYQVGTDAAEANSTVQSIVATAHAARRGDIVRFTSGDLAGYEFKVWSVSVNAIAPAEDLPAAPAATDAFEILRHRYPRLNGSGDISVSATLEPSALLFDKDGSDVSVHEDTAVPGNSRPLPIKIMDAGGVSLDLSAGGHAYVIDEEVRSTLTTIEGRIPSKGQKTMSGSVPVTMASDQGNLPISASSLPLPTGAATEADQDISNAFLDSIDSKITECNTGNVVVSSSALPTGASTSAKQDTGNTSLASIDGKITACNTGNVTVGSSALPTGAATAANQTTGNNSLSSIDSKVSRLSVVDLCDTPLVSGTSINGSAGAFYQAVATLAAAVKAIQCLDTTGVFMGVYTGAAASETLVAVIPPGADGAILDISIASGARVALRALEATGPSAGSFAINFLG